jgi:RNA polymerase sigma-70 factor (ECF subfamily)
MVRRQLAQAMVVTDVQALSQPDFADFYRLKREPVFRALALTLRNRDLAADAIDEAMARAYERWRTVSSYDNQEGWVYRVGLNWARSRLRKVRREVSTENMPERPTEDRGSDPDLDRALALLSLDRRTVVVLHHYMGMTYEQIGSALHIPAGTAKSRLHHAMEELRTAMQEGGE